MDIITREEALERGLKLWFNGIPCKRGHITTRRVNPNACSECQRLSKRKPPAEPRQCEHCGNDFLPHVRSRPVRFCSVECNGAFNRAQDSRRRAERRAQREALMQWLPGYMPRAKARELGLQTYFVGARCPRGHVAPHHVSGGCTICVAAYSRDWQRRKRQEDPESFRVKDRARVRPRTDEVRAKEAARRDANRQQVREYHQQYRAQRSRTDPGYRLACSLRSLVGTALRKQAGDKAYKTHQLIGCTIPELMAHLESQFQDGMTWQNRGRNGWHVDHIIPCAAFDLTDPEQQRQCFHFTNLQPLWEADNIRKGAKMPDSLPEGFGQPIPKR